MGKKIKLYKIVFALIGIFFIGIGVATNIATELGNDPIGIIYDGVRNALGLSIGQLDIVSNIVNFGLIALLLIVGRKYINLGTLIYILPYGFFLSIGTWLYELIVTSNALHIRIIAGLVGSFLLYVGVGIFIAMDMGVDPFSGIVLVIRDHSKMEFRKVKIVFDICMVIIGVVLGGKLGVITIFTAFTAGPCIQWVAANVSKLIRS